MKLGREPTGPGNRYGVFGTKWRRIYVPAWFWLAGYFSLLITIVGVIIWVNVFTCKEYAF